jgi:hypothetical protein
MPAALTFVVGRVKIEKKRSIGNQPTSRDQTNINKYVKKINEVSLEV